LKYFIILKTSVWLTGSNIKYKIPKIKLNSAHKV
jgi:hypothetical protein